MKLKDKYTWLKHLDFILIDFICIIVAFVLAYYLRFNSLDMFEEKEWSTLFVIICGINLIITFFVSPYSGILKRRYYQQFRKEILLFIYQVFITFAIFYALKIGTNFSRKMMFMMYGIYFVSSQTFKYFHKKILVSRLERRKQKQENSFKEGKDTVSIAYRIKHRQLKYVTYSIIKRIVDIIGGIVGCIILIPLTVFVFILNKFNEEEDGPVFYVQDRIGKNGKPFKMFKFRSMVVDADERLEQFLSQNEDIRKEFKIYRKIKNDPRVTRVGRFLRKTSLDEFPQFINVLIGDMSLVGPRPYLESEVEQMGEYQKVVITHKPGITGLWQVNGRSDVSFDNRLDMDIEYHKNYSLLCDFKILLKTALYVLRKKGAR